ncbi:unnamed protein product [Chilo suppressalis]|uniref:Uncharacterized protein n=1 Tax=Chilo suppressalis TaxID=168631 RepID=A0ABN8B6N0_CHISP|nr:unnamed protein product [Chilo suppressalis]
MKRVKKHHIKSEKPESSTSHERPKDDYDLVYYIHDRVELMHQVFSVLKHKDIKAMTPECVLHVSIDDLQELCTEELLGISSKRLCAILDGAEPPSDTESSSASQSPERLETISLDSISSDDEILSQSSSKKSKKRKHKHGSRSKKGKSRDAKEDSGEMKASRAGLTVLELLELQARARAIRAQLQQDQQHKLQESVPDSGQRDSDHDDGDVEIKEEPAEVVEISSDEDKPKVERISPDENIAKQAKTANENQTVTKRINDLIITVPQTKQTRKIKLNRNKAVATITNSDKKIENTVTSVNKIASINKDVIKPSVKPKEPVVTTKLSKITAVEDVSKDKQKKKGKKKGKKKNDEKEGSDHDEITLQLSDTEKMDLLEDLDRKNFDTLSSSSSEDSESSSSDSDSDTKEDKTENEKVDKISEEKEPQKATVIESSKENAISESNLVVNAVVNDKEHEVDMSENENCEVNKVQTDTTLTEDVEIVIEKDKCDDSITQSKSIGEETSCTDENTPKNTNKTIDSHKCDSSVQRSNSISVETSCTDKKTSQNTNKIEDDHENDTDNVIEVSSVKDIPVIDTESTNGSSQTSNNNETEESVTVEKEKTPDSIVVFQKSNFDENKADAEETLTYETVTESITRETKNLSDGELSERASSEIEAIELQPEVVCISDDETDKKSQKKKKKKEKKSKKEKKAKKSKSDFRESGDQNFFKETDKDGTNVKNTDTDDANIVKIDVASDNYDDVYEILELSDDSSCYEVEGTVLSKEPTAEEIEALSAKIDQIEREDVVTEEEIREHEMREIEENGERVPEEDLENISWKDRYLDSQKVKKVLSTSSIFNALRKKNKELKRKMEEAKKREEVKETEIENPPADDTNADVSNVVEGTIEHFNTLQGSTKYVDPVSVEPKGKPVDHNNEEIAINKEENEQSPQVTREMKKDAKQLLKMYKRLLKYNDMTKQKDPSKKKKKKKAKKKSKEAASVTGET